MDLSIAALHAAYRDGVLTPADLVTQLRARIQAHAAHNAWVTVLDDEALAPLLARLAGHSPDTLPLYGVPFAIKDNIDLAGVPTTAGCEAFASTPGTSATVVARLIQAGAVPLGKTTLDQFATGLVGTRSPWGACRNAFDPAYISGGSSAGSAVAVALGEVTFSLGTDTAGSGRVPAAFNNLIGVKPTRGRWSTHGIVPACRSLDCPSLFALNPDDARCIMAVLDGVDCKDPFSRASPPVSGPLTGYRLGVPLPAQRRFFGDAPQHYARLFDDTVARFAALGAELVEIDFAPFAETASLLYDGPWLAERYHAIRTLMTRQPDALLPVTREIIERGALPSAVDTFDAMYRLQSLRAQAQRVMRDVDVLLVPSAGAHFRIDAVQAAPVQRNTELGYYTNFVNLLDMAAMAVPAAFTDDGLPFGVTLIGPAFSDEYLLALAHQWLAQADLPCGATGRHWQAGPVPLPPGRIPLLVCGAHLSGLPLNTQLTERGAFLLESTHTAPCYRLYALAGGPPLRPGMARVSDGGAAIEVEIWSVPEAALGSFVAGIPAPLGIGKVALADGRWVSGFICEPQGLETATDITAFGGWRSYLASL